jgi:hypothetical protein
MENIRKRGCIVNMGGKEIMLGMRKHFCRAGEFRGCFDCGPIKLECLTIYDTLLSSFGDPES